MKTPTATHWGNYDVIADEGRVVELRAIDGDPEPSCIGRGVPRALYDSTRLTKPMVRRGWLNDGPRKGGNRRGADPFIAVAWDEALDVAAGELARIAAEHGNESIYGGSYGWGSAGRFHHAQSQLHRFLNLHGGYTSSVNTYSMAALEVLLPRVVGGAPTSIFSRQPSWAEIAAHGELVVAFGGLPRKNSQVNPGGVGAHNAAGLQRLCASAGVEFVSISPIAGDTDADLGAEWIAPRPNTDVALMLGLAHTLLVEDRHDRDFLARCCTGFDRLAAYILGESDGVPKDASWAAGIAEIDASVVENLARRIAAQRTLIAVSWSVQRARHGEQPYWMGVALAAMSGSMGRPGGGFGAGYGAIDAIGGDGVHRGVAAVPQGTNAVSAYIPVARISDMLLNPGATIDYDGASLTYPDIRLVYWCGGNPFHHHQDINKLVGAWQQPETIIVNEAWWTPLARFADIVFPIATAFERDDFAVGFLDGWISAMHKAADPPGQARTDYAVFAELAARLGFGDRFTEGRTPDEWIRQLYGRTREALRGQGAELPSFESFWTMGRLGLPTLPRGTRGSFAALRDDPERNPLDTPSGRIEIYSRTIAGFGYDDCPGHPCWLEPDEWLGSSRAERFPLHLMTNQPRTRLHSQYDNGGESLASKVAGREPVTIHPEDAAARGIVLGDVVRIFNDRGACLAGAVLSSSIRPGVVQLSTGAWYDPELPGVAGSIDLHGNPNVLTLDLGTSRLAQGPSAQTALVEVERFPGTPPPVGAFEPPVIVPRVADARP